MRFSIQYLILLPGILASSIDPCAELCALDNGCVRAVGSYCKSELHVPVCQKYYFADAQRVDFTFAVVASPVLERRSMRCSEAAQIVAGLSATTTPQPFTSTPESFTPGLPTITPESFTTTPGSAQTSSPEETTTTSDEWSITITTVTPESFTTTPGSAQTSTPEETTTTSDEWSTTITPGFPTSTPEQATTMPSADVTAPEVSSLLRNLARLDTSVDAQNTSLSDRDESVESLMGNQESNLSRPFASRPFVLGAAIAGALAVGAGVYYSQYASGTL